MKECKSKKFYSLFQVEQEADLTIFGDITSFPWMESDVSAYNLVQELEQLDVDTINVHINSYGGEVAEGLAIYNALRRHKAKVKTFCDGFACSIASVIFMAGDERVMNKSSLLMIHNAWTYAEGNAEELRKIADDIEKITQASINAYLESVNLSEKKLKKMLDAETWLSYQEALEYGFATSVVENAESDRTSQSARKAVFDLIMQKAKSEEEDLDDDIEGDDIDDDIEIKEEAKEEETPKEEETSEEDSEEEDEETSTDDSADEGSEDEEDEESEKPNEATERVAQFFNFLIK